MNPIIDTNDITRYLVNGLYHREDGPALVTGKLTSWYLNGELHREDGPAVEYNDGSIMGWYRNDVLHREDGPAYIDSSGQYWWLNGVEYTKEQYTLLMFFGDKDV